MSVLCKQCPCCANSECVVQTVSVLCKQWVCCVNSECVVQTVNVLCKQWMCYVNSECVMQKWTRVMWAVRALWKKWGCCRMLCKQWVHYVNSEAVIQRWVCYVHTKKNLLSNNLYFPINDLPTTFLRLISFVPEVFVYEEQCTNGRQWGEV